MYVGFIERNGTISGLENGTVLKSEISITWSDMRIGNTSILIIWVDGVEVHNDTIDGAYLLDAEDLSEGNHTLDFIVNHADGNVTSGSVYFTAEHHTEKNMMSLWYLRYLAASGGMFMCMVCLGIYRLKDVIFGLGSQVAEEQVKERTKGAVLTAAKSTKGTVTPQDIILMVVGLAVLGLAFGYSTMIGEMGINPIRIAGNPTIYPPGFSADTFIFSLPAALLCGGLLVLGAEVVEWSTARKKDIECHLSFWPVGLASLALSSILFIVPFGYPIKFKLAGEDDVSKKDKGHMALSVALFLGAMLIPFALIAMIPFAELVGKIGLSVAIMLFCYTLVPIKPMEGWSLFKWNKPLWFGMFFSSIGLFVSWSVFQSYFIVYGLVGLVFAGGLGFLYYTISKAEKVGEEE